MGSLGCILGLRKDLDLKISKANENQFFKVRSEPPNYTERPQPNAISTLYGDKGFLDPCVSGVLKFAAIHSTLATWACGGTPDPSALCIESASGPFSRSEGVSNLVLTLA